MSNEIVWLVIVAWLTGMTLFVVYCILDVSALDVNEGTLSEWEAYALLDEEWLSLESPVYSYYTALTLPPLAIQLPLTAHGQVPAIAHASNSP